MGSPWEHGSELQPDTPTRAGDTGSLLGAVVHVLDHPRRKRLQGQSVVNGDGDPARGRVATDDAADLGLKGKVAAFVLRHLHPVHPLQPRQTFTR